MQTAQTCVAQGKGKGKSSVVGVCVGQPYTTMVCECVWWRMSQQVRCNNVGRRYYEGATLSVPNHNGDVCPRQPSGPCRNQTIDRPAGVAAVAG